MSKNGYKVWMCVVCGWVYEEENSDPAAGLLPRTSWQDVPGDRTCPDCSAGKDDFDMMEL